METELFYQAVMNLLAPVEPLFERDDISEIMINGPDEVYIESEGKLVLTDVKFASQSSIDSAILNMGQFARRAVGPDHPILEARMPDGSRVTVVVPPVSKRGPVISIRKFTKITKRISDLTALGSMSGEMERFFADVIPMRKNLVVAGGAGSGKTTLLNDLGTFISPTERIVVIEDTSELELQQPHVLPLEVMLREETGDEPIDVRRLVKTALRLRPDRIIIGEVRGEEAVDLVQAMNTGHAGSMATLHSNSPIQTLMRLETMFLMARLELPIGAIRHQIASSLDLIVQTSRFPDGTRKITHVSEVLELDDRDAYQVQHLFEHRIEGIAADGRVKGAHHAVSRPTFAGQMIELGSTFPFEIFPATRKIARTGL